MQHSLRKISLYGKWVKCMVEVPGLETGNGWSNRNLYLVIEYFVPRLKTSGLDALKKLQVFPERQALLHHITSARRRLQISFALLDNQETDEPVKIRFRDGCMS